MSTHNRASKSVSNLSNKLSRLNKLNVNELPFDEDNNVSASDIKRLFFIWFNSISNDSKSLNKSQFSIILNRIFSSSTTPLTQTQIIQIFNQLSNDNDNIIYFNKFLSQNDDSFVDIITPLLKNDQTTISILKSIPSLTTNNPNNNTLQQILYDQSKQIELLKQWILEIGLPSHQRKRTLQQELSDVIEDKSRLDMALQLVCEEKDDLQNNQDTMSRSYSTLNDDYNHSVQQNNHLKSLNEEYKAINVKLQSSLNKKQKELETEQEENKQYQRIIDDLTKLNEQYKKTNNQLMIKNEQQMKQITNLSNMNNQIEIAMESTAMALEQKTEQNNKLQQELEVLKCGGSILESDGDDLESNINDDIASPTLRLTVTGTSVDSLNKTYKSPQNVHTRKSYIFAVRTPITAISDNNMSFEGAMNAFNMNINTTSSPLPYNNPLIIDNGSIPSPTSSAASKQSILSVGGGHPMSFFNTSQEFDKLDTINEYNKLHSDEKNGVDVYVFTQNQDNKYNKSSPTSSPFIPRMDDEFVLLSDDDSADTQNNNINNQNKNGILNEYDAKYAIQLKEMQIKHDLEMMKLRKQLESMKSKKDIFEKPPPLPSFRESMEYKTDDIDLRNNNKMNGDHHHDNDDGDYYDDIDYNNNDQTVPLINNNKKKKEKNIVPRGFNDHNNQKCVVFGWDLW